MPVKTQEDIKTRIAELRADRERLVGELEKARVDEREALIRGDKPDNVTVAISTRIAVIDDALAELNDRLTATQASAQRNERRKRAEAALHKTSERAKLAATVDDALTALATAWPAYQEALRKDLGTVSGAGGDLRAVERGLTNKRLAEPLVKALIHAGGGTLARALGIETTIKDRHSLSLSAAEERVAESLRTELLRVRAESPQPNVAREAKQELEKMENAG